MNSGITLGLDVGTTSVKVVALDATGTVVATATNEHGILRTERTVEADADAWVASAFAAVRSLDIDRSKVRAVGMSGNMSSVVLVDDDLRAIRPALLLADPRGADELAALPAALTERLVVESGNRPASVFTLASLLWLNARNELTARRWLPAKDYLRARLTGEYSTDATDAANTLLVREDRSWNVDLAGRLGFEAAGFPPLRRSDELGGTISDDASRDTGIPSGVPVAIGGGDVATAIEGGGGLEPHELGISLGTSVTLMAPIGGRTAPDGLTVHPDARGGRFALGSLLTGGLALNWLRSIDPELTSAGDAPGDSGDVVMLPQLAGSGSPDFVDAARGTVFGITPTTTTRQLTSALQQAVAFELRMLVQSLEGDYTSVVLSGGGARLAGWPQIIADVLGVPVRTLDSLDLSARGAAVLAWRALGVEVPTPRTAGRSAPRVTLRPEWDRAFERYGRARTTAFDFYIHTTTGAS